MNKNVDIKVAADAKDRSFVAAPACTEAMYNIWYDKIHPNQAKFTDRLALFVAFITLGLAAPAFVTYREKKQVFSKFFSHRFVSTFFLSQEIVGETPEKTYVYQREKPQYSCAVLFILA